MKSEQKMLLANAGIDFDSALARFMGNEALCFRFLMKFAEDPSYDALCEALAQGDCESAFRASHTLKGVAGNLSLTALFDALSAQAELLRLNELDMARAMQPRITEAYQAVLAALSKL